MDEALRKIACWLGALARLVAVFVGFQRQMVLVAGHLCEQWRE